MTEIWKPVPEYEGVYEVSSHGRVRSLDRVVTQMSRWGMLVPRKRKGRVVNPSNNGNGYLYLTARKGGKVKHLYVHRLVADAFVSNPDGKPCVNHKDHNRGNNRADNLEWLTQKENIRYSAHLMVKPRSTPTTSSTGHKYIYKRDNRFRLVFPRGMERQYATLEEAIAAREVSNHDGQHFADRT